MATAPKPGTKRLAAEAAASTEAAKSVLYFTYENEPLSLAWQVVPILERVEVRKATGLPWEAFCPVLGTGAPTIGEDSLCVLWWLARRAHGERGLTWDQAMSEWDVDQFGDLRLALADPRGDDPEA